MDFRAWLVVVSTCVVVILSCVDPLALLKCCVHVAEATGCGPLHHPAPLHRSCSSEPSPRPRRPRFEPKKNLWREYSAETPSVPPMKIMQSRRTEALQRFRLRCFKPARVVRRGMMVPSFLKSCLQESPVQPFGGTPQPKRTVIRAGGHGGSQCPGCRDEGLLGLESRRFCLILGFGKLTISMGLHAAAVSS